MKKTHLQLLFKTIFFFNFLNRFDAKANDSTTFVRSDKIGIYFSGDFCNTINQNALFRENNTGSFGYKIDLNYIKTFNKLLSLEMGISYSELKYKGNRTDLSWLDDITVTTNSKYKLNYLEIPCYLRINFGKSNTTNFSLKFGPALTALIKGSSHVSIKTNDPNGTIIEDEFSQQYSYSFFSGEYKVQYNFSFGIGAGVDTKVSEAVNLNFLVLSRFYERSMSDLFTAGIQIGLNYRI